MHSNTLWKAFPDRLHSKSSWELPRWPRVAVSQVPQPMDQSCCHLFLYEPKAKNGSYRFPCNSWNTIKERRLFCKRKNDMKCKYSCPHRTFCPSNCLPAFTLWRKGWESGTRLKYLLSGPSLKKLTNPQLREFADFWDGNKKRKHAGSWHFSSRSQHSFHQQIPHLPALSAHWLSSRGSQKPGGRRGDRAPWRLRDGS